MPHYFFDTSDGDKFVKTTKVVTYLMLQLRETRHKRCCPIWLAIRCRTGKNGPSVLSFEMKLASSSIGWRYRW